MREREREREREKERERELCKNQDPYVPVGIKFLFIAIFVRNNFLCFKEICKSYVAYCTHTKEINLGTWINVTKTRMVKNIPSSMMSLINLTLLSNNCLLKTIFPPIFIIGY